MMKDQQTSIGRKATTEALKQACAFYFFRYGFAIALEIGVMPWGARRADLVANKVNGSIVIAEVKSSLADFRADLKWKSYLDYCDKFVFMTTEDVFKKIRDELPPEVGVLCLCPRTGYAYMAKRCPILKTITDKNRLSVLARLAYRAADMSKRTKRSRQRVFLDGKKPSTLDMLSSPGRKRRLSKKAKRAWAKKRRELYDIQSLVNKVLK